MTPKKILIVEDDKMLCTLFDMFIRDLGHEVIAFAQNSKEAVQICKSLVPDVILMDIHIQGKVDGIETAKIINQHFDVPIVYISSDTEEDTVRKSIHDNTYGFLVKPIHKSSLGILIESAYYKHKHDKQQKTNERRRALIDVAKKPIFVIGDQKIQYLNYHGQELLKSSDIEQFIDQDFDLFIALESQEKLRAQLAETVQGENVFFENFNTIMLTSDGQKIPVSLKGSKIVFYDKSAVQLEVTEV